MTEENTHPHIPDYEKRNEEIKNIGGLGVLLNNSINKEKLEQSIKDKKDIIKNDKPVKK